LIKENTTDEIYENYKIESDCVYYEMIYGNNDEYTENVKNSFLNSLKIVIDSGNGVCGDIAPKLYIALGCEVITLVLVLLQLSRDQVFRFLYSSWN
jgi:phosphomannomutase